MTSVGTDRVDLVVVGLGPGGEALATAAASAGLQVVAIDKHLVGGECPYYGCIPSKMMIRAADALAESHRASELAGRVDVTPSWTPVAERIADQATDHWDDRVAVERLEAAGATVLHGVGRLDGERTVVVETTDGAVRRFAARRGIVLNPGTRPAVPPVPGLAGTPYWTNRDAVQVTELPDSLAVLGGGPIGCELAQVIARFGVRVTLVQRGPALLPRDEPEAGEELRRALEAEGVRVLTDTTTSAVTRHDDRFTLTVEKNARDEELVVDRLLVAAGRTPNLDDLGLASVGLDPAARTLATDDRMRVAPGLWAIGDVVGEGAFTHVSMYQSAVALRDVLGEDGDDGDDGPAADYRALPHVTFTDPEVAGVGRTESDARAAGIRVRVGMTRLEQSSRGFTHGPGASGLVKIVADAERGVLVGATVVGPAGGEILGLLALAVHAEVPIATLRTMIYAYPTFHRAIESALGELA